jgi:hypothetical protein
MVAAYFEALWGHNSLPEAMPVGLQNCINVTRRLPAQLTVTIQIGLL